MSSISKLSFREKCTPWEKGERWSFDIFINERSLLDYLGIPNADYRGSFGWRLNQEYELKEIDEFRKGNFPRSENGLFPLYVCPECGDIGCGAIVCKIEELGDRIIWSDFAHSDGSLPVYSDHISDSPAIVFDKNQYMEAMNELEIAISDRKKYPSHPVRRIFRFFFKERF